MDERRLILVVDDNPDNREILVRRVESLGHDAATAVDGDDALDKAAELRPDLILLDVMMPGIDGLEVCRRLRAGTSSAFVPIILVTAKSKVADVVAGLEAGADDYLAKPVDHAALVARLRAMLRIKALHDQVEAQRAELADWNASLERRVAEQVEEIERVGRLRRFLSPEVAEIVVSTGAEDRLASHRAEVTVLFADLRGFTAYSERVAPEEVMAALGAFHALAGPLIERYEGTLERFLGDGVMVLFNDPLPCPDPQARAVRLALALRDGFERALLPFAREDASLGLGIGIAHGPATMGRIGFEGRWDYAAIGTAANLAARLCDLAENGRILVTDEVARASADVADAEFVDRPVLKGFADPVEVFSF